MTTSVQTLPDPEFYAAFAGRVRETVAEHTRTADQAPAAEPLLPACHVCGDTAGPWYPDPSGDRWPSGAQKLVCGQHHVEPVADVAATNRSVDAYLGREYPSLFPAEVANAVPTTYKDAARITAPGARGAMLAAWLLTTDDEPESTTYLSVCSEPDQDADMNIEQARKFRARVAAFLPKLDAMIAAMPQPTAPTVTGRTWTITTDAGVKVSGYLPAWAENDPSLQNVPANRLQLQLSDLTFTRDYRGPLMTVDAPFGEDCKHEVAEDEVFRAQIWCAPHDDHNPDEREPYGIITVLPDCVMDHLSPPDMATVAAQLRAQADAIEQAGVDLAAARADWARNGGAK